jgi:hypothetical protein
MAPSVSRAFPVKTGSPEMLDLFVFTQSGRKTADAFLLDML